jgi:hypothetical protein
MSFLSSKVSKGINILLVLALLLYSVYFTFTTPVKAATFTKYYVFLDKIEATAGTGGIVCVKPATTSSSNHDLKITWPSGFTVSGTTGNWAATTSNIPLDINGTVPTAWPGITSATASVSTQTVTWTYSSDQTLSSSNIYCFRFASSSALTLPSATSGAVDKGTITTETVTPTTIDTGDFAMAIVSGTTDQISVTSTVTPTFNFALGSNSIALGNLPISGTPATGNTTMTISTNALNGWNAWVKSANAGLFSSSTGQTIASQGTYPTTTDINGTEGYQLNGVATTGSPTIAPGYLNAATTHIGGKLDAFYENLATMTSPTSNAVVTLNLLAEAAATRIASTDYNDTLTVVASGSF